MADIAIHALRMPRLLTGVAMRCREVERIAVWDDVPVGIRKADADEAPVAYRRTMNGKSSKCRVHDGRAYAVLGAGSGSPALAWGRVVEQVRQDLQFHLGMLPTAPTSPYTALSGWQDELRGASRKRGFVDGASTEFKETRDDGRALQARSAATLADRMLCIGDDLWFRVSLPRITVDVSHGTVIATERSNNLLWKQGSRFGTPLSAGSFRVDRRDEAEAYAAMLSQETGCARVDETYSRIDVIDADAVASLYRAAGTDELLGLHAVTQTLADALKAELGFMPEEEIIRFSDMLRLRLGDDAAGLHAWMETGLDALGKAYVALKGEPDPRRPHPGEDTHAKLAAATMRYRGFEVPRRDLASGDEAALLSL